VTDTALAPGEPTRSPARAAGNARPRKPPPGLFGIGLGVAAVTITVLAVRATEFSVADIFDTIGNKNPVLEALPHAELSQIFSPRSRAAFMDTLRMAVLASIAGSIVALPFALLSTRFGAPWLPLRGVVRLVSGIVRAVPEILWAMLFVAGVSIGKLAGLLALFMFTIAVVTKLTADTIDGIDTGPLEAADAAGAGRTQMLRTAVIPQILPAYSSFVLYAFELNIRGSAVLGFVGAGGIGERIQFFQGQNDWERMWGITVMFIAVVFVIDRISTLLRRRLV
jgi:phosphonate transport system permease protein